MRYDVEVIAQAATLACLLEASAEKPGNVTPTHSFRDMTYEDFLGSAVAIGPELGRAGQRGVGATILAAVQATRLRASANTNLGLVLLLAPLAAAAAQAQLARHTAQDPNLSIPGRAHPEANAGEGDLRLTHYELRAPALRKQLGRVLRSLTVEDAKAAYAAIRLAVPGGLAVRVEKHDVRDEPAVSLLEAMAEAAGRDSIASEYASEFAITFELGLPAWRGAVQRGLVGRAAAVQTYLELLAAVPDTLIGRKKGRAVAEEVSRGAAAVVAAGGMASPDGRQAMAAFDADLRDAANALNPGTTADLTGATLFVALLEGI